MILTMEAQQRNDVVLLMIPAAAQGHLNPMLHLAKMISTRGGLPVHFICSATHNRQAKDRVQGWDPSTLSNIHFHDYQLPEIVTPPPDPHSSDKFPSHLNPIFVATYTLLKEPLAVLIQDLSSSYRRVVIVIDHGIYFAVTEQASLLSKAEVYCLNTFSPFAKLYLEWEAFGCKPIDQGGDTIPRDLPRVVFEGANAEVMLQLAVLKSQYGQLEVGDIYNTCDAIEGRFVDMLSKLEPSKKHWAMGPFDHILDLDSSKKDGSQRHRCLEWLDKHPKNSVIYISFGTTTSMSDEQIAEIATALERTEQRFVWVLRDADRGDIFKEEARKPQLPVGFEKKTQEVGMIVRDWAPQLQILAHKSIGGFVSHCGWNSCLESFSMGVPIAAWPMYGDQPRNAMLASEVLKVGFVVFDWARRGELVSADVIETSVKKLMVSEEGDRLRKRADELGITIREAVSEGGSSMTQLESFLTHIQR